MISHDGECTDDLLRRGGILGVDFGDEICSESNDEDHAEKLETSDHKEKFGKWKSTVRGNSHNGEW